ncbi:MAG TPA: hypothetical protein VFQ26_07430 [Nitrospiraceae bacterium]|nr:hypothetical protein [Nitrospiraceae bacterium]
MLRAILIVAVLAAPVLSLGAESDLARRASWSQPTADEVKLQLDAWLATRQLDDVQRQQVAEIWNDSVSGDHLAYVAASIAVAQPEFAQLVEFCRGESSGLSPEPFVLLTDEQFAPFVRSNLRLYFGRWLAQRNYYDEALAQLQGLTPNDVVDPASLLFFQSVVNHRLLNKTDCLVTLERLLENEKVIPQRYLSVARLMRADIKPLETDSLDEVSRLMDDIRRRLDLGRAGKKVRDEEDDVIAKLDKMIEKMEEQQKQQQANSSSGQGALNPSNPAEDSVPAGGSGPGDVDPKRLTNKSGWGNLPPKDRQEALQQISKDLPAHFREVIEEYFRKLARDGGEEP